MQLTSPGSRNWDKGGQSPKIPFRPHFGRKIRGGAPGPPGPSPKSATAACLSLECWVISHREWMIPPWMDGTLQQLTRSNMLNSKGTVGKKFLKISYRIWDGEEQFLCGTTTFTSRLQNPFDELRINYQPSLRSKPLLWAQLIKQAPWWQPWKMQVLVICNNFT